MKHLVFRPLPGFTAFALTTIALLVGLGIWQIQRLHWKLGLIAAVSHHMTGPALSLDQALALSADEVRYHRIALNGHFENDKEAYVFTTNADGAPVYHVLTPFVTDDGRAVLVDRGEVPKQKLSPASRVAPVGERRIVGIWHKPGGPGPFTPAPERAKRIWFARDLAGIAAADHIKLAAPTLIEADATPNPGGWPRGGQTVIDFPNNHLSYAMTWFGLAVGLFGVYLAYHISKGRLTLR